MIEYYLKKAIRSGHLAHAYLLSGGTGQDRRTAAEDCIRTLLCENGNGCGKCHACKQILAGTHPDVIRVTHEKPQTISVKEVRDQVCDSAELRPFSAAHKVILMEDAQMMPPGAQNALLKTIEEPPAYLVIFLLADSEQALLDTIRSRCVSLKLSEGSEYEKDPEIFRENIQILTEIRKEGMNRIPEAMTRIQSRGSGALQDFVCFARAWYRDILAWQTTGTPERLLFPAEREAIARQAGELSYETIEKAIAAMDTAEERLRFSVNPDLTAELLLLAL